MLQKRRAQKIFVLAVNLITEKFELPLPSGWEGSTVLRGNVGFFFIWHYLVIKRGLIKNKPKNGLGRDPQDLSKGDEII